MHILKKAFATKTLVKDSSSKRDVVVNEGANYAEAMGALEVLPDEIRYAEFTVEHRGKIFHILTKESRLVIQQIETTK